MFMILFVLTSDDKYVAHHLPLNTMISFGQEEDLATTTTNYFILFRL